MNILFFLTPKSDVRYVYTTDSIGTATDEMLDSKYTTIPVLEGRTGKYVGTLAGDDLLRELRKHSGLTVTEASERLLSSLPRRRDYRSVKADAKIEDLLSFAETQNFVPVTDDTNTFIGIVTRSALLQHLLRERR